MNIADYVVIVIGPNVWGKGETIGDARRKAGSPRKYVAYLAHPETVVGEIDGSLAYPRECPPRLLDRVGLKKGKNADAIL